ncbi:MAG: hypothetical protein HFG77_13815, partial [Hungatella sp.]|nr:hypothetical protein [Hungatella sp.]
VCGSGNGSGNNCCCGSGNRPGNNCNCCDCCGNGNGWDHGQRRAFRAGYRQGYNAGYNDGWNAAVRDGNSCPGCGCGSGGYLADNEYVAGAEVSDEVYEASVESNIAEEAE